MPDNKDELEEILLQYKRGFSNMDDPNHALTKYDIHRAIAAIKAYNRNQLKSLKAKIESEKLERPESGPNRNGTAQAVRAAHNKALSKVNNLLDELIGEK